MKASKNNQVTSRNLSSFFVIFSPFSLSLRPWTRLLTRWAPGASRNACYDRLAYSIQKEGGDGGICEGDGGRTHRQGCGSEASLFYGRFLWVESSIPLVDGRCLQDEWSVPRQLNMIMERIRGTQMREVPKMSAMGACKPAEGNALKLSVKVKRRNWSSSSEKARTGSWMTWTKPVQWKGWTELTHWNPRTEPVHLPH